MNSKKGEMRTILYSILGCVVLFLIVLFNTVGFLELGGDYIIDPIVNASIDVGEQRNITGLNTTVLGLQEEYESFVLPPDLFFLTFFFLCVGSTCAAAFKARKLGVFSFFGYITIGSMVFLSAVFFLDQFADWWLNEFFFVLFNDITINTPFMDFFLEHLSLICTIWFFSLLLINQLDLNLPNLNLPGRGRVEK